MSVCRGVLDVSTWIVLSALLACVTSAQTPKLLDPQRSIFRAFPAADSYRVIERDVLAAERRQIEKCVPFRVHFEELGRHSLYVALRGQRPLGMIYVQHEECDFGLAAFEWGVSFDLRASSFHFQQARSPHRQSLEGSAFIRSLLGTSNAELTKLLDEQGRLRRVPKDVDPEAAHLATAIVRSAVKSIAVLDVVWHAEVGRLRDLSIGMGEFDRCTFARRLWPLGRRQLASDAKAKLTYAIAAYNGRGQPLGLVAIVRSGSAGKHSEARCKFDAAQRLTKASTSPDAPASLRAALGGCVGKKLAEIAVRKDGIGAAGQELLRAIAAEPADKRRKR